VPIRRSPHKAEVDPIGVVRGRANAGAEYGERLRIIGALLEDL